MKPCIPLTNTNRGRILDTCVIIGALKSQHIGLPGLDAYEEEENGIFTKSGELKSCLPL